MQGRIRPTNTLPGANTQRPMKPSARDTVKPIIITFYNVSRSPCIASLPLHSAPTSLPGAPLPLRAAELVTANKLAESYPM